MKRSDVIIIGIACGATATIILSQWPRIPELPSGPEEIVFAGGSGAVDDCVNAGIARDTCAADYQRALAAHQAQAPVFPSAEACQEATDSSCEAQPATSLSAVSTAPLFAPVMAGFMLSQPRGQAGGNTYVSAPVYASQGTSGSYRALADLGRDKNARPSTGGGVYGGWSGTGKRPDAATLRPYAPSTGANMKTTSVSRSGFGGGRFGSGA